MLGALVDYSDDSEVEFDAGGGLTKRPEPVAKPAKRKNSGSSHPPAGPKKSKTLPKLESTLFTPGVVRSTSYLRWTHMEQPQQTTLQNTKAVQGAYPLSKDNSLDTYTYPSDLRESYCRCYEK
ncbi:hypothetical protein FRC06_008602 [Ceratobasidium sp. 370]|nr:hypothetical protein FRC06_008602 [Ceratobasidium sp. 370]